MHDVESQGSGASTEASRRMGLVPLVLDQGVSTTAIGLVYGLDFAVQAAGFSMRVYFDHYNRRIRVIDYEASDYLAMSQRLIWLAKENGFDKVFLKAHGDDWLKFLPSGFILEGILRYYFGGEDAFVLSYFGSLERFEAPHLLEESDLIERLGREPEGIGPVALPPGIQLITVDESRIDAIVAHYQAAFEGYPVPLIHADYLWQCLRRGVLFVAAVDPEGTVVSCGSATLTGKGSAEISDCSTLVAHRGKRLILHVVRELERASYERGVRSSFALARSREVGHNRLFQRLGYEYSGRLLNQFFIGEAYENMNIWTRSLLSEPKPLAAAVAEEVET